MSRLNTATSITWAWDPGKAIAAPAFYTITGGALTATTPTAFTVTVKSLCPEFAGGRISGAMEYSVCPNANTPIAVKDPVPMFATANTNFPGGLEFQIVGQSGERKIMTRFVTAAWYARKFNSQEASVVTYSHGF